MIDLALILVVLLGISSRTTNARDLPVGEVFAVSANCSAGSQPCGPAPSCCPAGLECKFRRGIPMCLNENEPFISGYDHEPCADPYLFRCDIILGISGFCCPIGTSCFTHGTDKAVYCIDALGTTAPPFPSATTGVIPSSTPILGSSSAIVYSPSNAWNTSNASSNCTTSNTLHVTDTVNASLSFTYTGPSVMAHVVTSPNGGVFSVLVDGFNTTSTIDTFSGPGNLSLPLCYPIQFPPFAAIPTGFESQGNHNLTLVYIGPSPNAPEGTTSGLLLFDSFAIPNSDTLLPKTNNCGPTGLQNLNLHLFSIFVVISSLFVVL